MENSKNKSSKLNLADQGKYFKKHLKGAVVRSIGGLMMMLFGTVMYLTGCITGKACAGSFTASLFVVLMNIPALLLIKKVQSRLFFDLISILINLFEISCYTAVIYFLGGINAAYLVPIYSAVISYVGIIAPKRYPYIIAGLCAFSFAIMVVAEHAGVIPHHSLIQTDVFQWQYVLWVIVMVTVALFSVAVITGYSSGILKKTRNDLIKKNLELEGSRLELSLYSEYLEYSEKKYRRVFESIQNIYLETENDGTIIEISPSVESVAGVKREAFIGKSIYDTIYSGPGIVKQLMNEICESDGVKDREIHVYDMDGDKVYFSVSARVVKDEYRPDGRVLIDASNVTARRKAEEALRESEERYRNLIEELKDVVFIVTPEGFIEYCSPASIEFGGYDPIDTIGKHVSDFVADDEGIEIALEMLLEMLTHKKTLGFELLYKPAVKEPFYVEISANPVMADGEITGVLCIMRDISHRKFAEEQVRLLSQELMKIQENERKRIACDLHDDVAQNLASLMISCETFFDSTEDVSGALKKKMSNFTSVLKRSLTFVRDLSYELRPPGLDQLGLIKTLSRYCEDFSEKHMVRVDFFAVGMEEITFDSDTEINIYRLIQEALNNIKKHADADLVVIKFVASVPDIILRIGDNGRGFDVNERLASAMAEKRMGLHSMTERTNFMNGKIKFNSQANEGTMIIVEIPGNSFRKGFTDVSHKSE